MEKSRKLPRSKGALAIRAAKLIPSGRTNKRTLHMSKIQDGFARERGKEIPTMTAIPMRTKSASHFAPAICAMLLCALAVSAGVQAGPKIIPDVTYGHKDGMALTFDVIAPTGASNGAGILFMVSGGWVSQWGPPENFLKPFASLLDAGFTLFPVCHGSSPKYAIPDAVADVRRAVRFIRMNAAQWGIDPNRLGVMGGSAGGHLSLMLGLASDEGDANSKDPVLRVSDRVAAVVALYPPVDLRGLEPGALPRRPGDADFLKRPLKLEAFNFDPKLAADYSPILFVSKDDPPTLLIHGDKDDVVSVKDSIDINAALKEKGVPTEALILPGAVHGFQGEDGKRSTEATAAWFKKYLMKSGEANVAAAAPAGAGANSSASTGANPGASTGEPRIPPMKESDMTAGQKELLKDRLRGGSTLHVFTTFVTNEELYRAWIPFGAYILSGSKLKPRDRELAILRIGYLCHAEYEWAQHARIAKGVGLKDEEITRITAGPDAKGWSDEDATLLRAVDELHKDSKIADATWAALAKRYDTKQLMDLVFTVGEYNLVSMGLNSFGVQLEKGQTGFPSK